MSLRARLMLILTGMAAVLSLILVAIQINTLIQIWLDQTDERVTLTAHFVKSYVQDRAQERAGAVVPQPDNLDRRMALWREVIARDRELPELLGRTLAQRGSVVEISVAGEWGRTLACSNADKVGVPITPRLPLQSLKDRNPLDRFLLVWNGTVDYEHRVELGVEGRKDPVFTIQVLVSSVLLRDAIMPEVGKTAIASLPLFFFSSLAAWLVAGLALRPLAGISRAIDQIASGQAGPAAPGVNPAATRELAAVQEKLRLLGEQFRGAQMGASQLRDSVERLTERLEEGIFLFDEDGRITMCSETAERMLEVNRGDITGKFAGEVFPPTEPLGAALATALGSRQPVREAVVGRQMLNVDILPGGGALARMRDAEGRRIVENQLNLSTRLAAISRLTSGVAHEIKNPLNSIALRLELLRSRVLPEMPDATGELDVIAQEIMRLDRVVRTFLDFTRPVEIETRDLDLGQLTGELVELLRPEAERGGVSVETSGLDGPAPMRGDADLLKQALMNVLRNGLEAMPDGGKLGVRLSRENNEAVICIEDTGPGIPRESRDKVFQLYYSTKKAGMGIGLAMTYRAVQLHNGGVEVGGADGEGTVFRLRFPLSGGDGR
ncbi:MAG: PAS domain-containing protein [Acidobacteria bacterium]|nr:PAS domain-containing protein [Acidobacteriota bacterium]